MKKQITSFNETMRYITFMKRLGYENASTRYNYLKEYKKCIDEGIYEDETVYYHGNEVYIWTIPFLHFLTNKRRIEKGVNCITLKDFKNSWVMLHEKYGF